MIKLHVYVFVCVHVCVCAHVFACICSVERFLQILIEDFPIRNFRKILITCGLKTQLKIELFNNIVSKKNCMSYR